MPYRNLSSPPPPPPPPPPPGWNSSARRTRPAGRRTAGDIAATAIAWTIITALAVVVVSLAVAAFVWVARMILGA